MALDSQVHYNVVSAGPAYSHRSLLVYGVLSEGNVRAQWRSRNVFPTVRNEQATALGLRRSFVVADERFGTLPSGVGPSDENPYGYAFASSCPSTFMRTAEPAPLGTLDRALFDTAGLPLSAATAVHLCATSTVTDATGTFVAPALARKNPEVRPAFPVLKSPIRLDRQIKFVLRPCQRTISPQHLAMQEQRILWTDADNTVCIDDFRSDSFVTKVAGAISAKVNAVRAQGEDMLLTVALHHDDTTGQLGLKVEAALDQVLQHEGTQSSPRLAGAFVLDSYPHMLLTDSLKRQVLWCPAVPILDPNGATASAQACAVMPDLPDLKLGPFSFGLIPILPTREKYLDFISKYSDAQAGHVTRLEFRAPERTPTSSDMAIGDFGVATFFNGEIITAAPSDAFSYCPTESPPPVVFRVGSALGPAPLSYLPPVHAQAHLPTYELGLAWDFPYLMRMDYEIVLAGAATAFTVTVPFGISTTTQAYYGTQLWEQGEFSLVDVLAQCTRFCDLPTFDSAGVYGVLEPFDPSYADRCHRPLYPTPEGGGFPRDP